MGKLRPGKAGLTQGRWHSGGAAGAGGGSAPCSHRTPLGRSLGFPSSQSHRGVETAAPARAPGGARRAHVTKHHPFPRLRTQTPFSTVGHVKAGGGLDVARGPWVADTPPPTCDSSGS